MIDVTTLIRDVTALTTNDLCKLSIFLQDERNRRTKIARKKLKQFDKVKYYANYLDCDCTMYGTLLFKQSSTAEVQSAYSGRKYDVPYYLLEKIDEFPIIKV